MRKNKSVTETVQEEFNKDTQGCFVAAILMLSFAGSLAWGFWLVGYIIYKTFNADTPPTADNFSAIIKDSLQVVTTIGTLFSPLLAFILGYYFNQSQQARVQTEKSNLKEDEEEQQDGNS